jgi:predicted nuclease with TOPRIM domain
MGQAQLASRCEEAERQLSVLTAEAAAAREKADALCAEVEALKGRWEGSAKEAEAAW